MTDKDINELIKHLPCEGGHAECHNRIDYQCTNCEIANALRTIKGLQERLMWLETEADPQHTIQDNYRLTQDNKALQTKIEQLQKALTKPCNYCEPCGNCEACQTTQQALS